MRKQTGTSKRMYQKIEVTAGRDSVRGKKVEVERMRER